MHTLGGSSPGNALLVTAMSPPTSQVLTRRRPVALLTIATAIGKDEVVAQVYGVPLPSDEMIDVGCCWR
jgi:hypothetical protein